MPQKSVAIIQSNYIPWKGYFDMIRRVDEFVLYDDMQYTRRDWRNRNQLKTPDGIQWLTIPVETKGKYHQAIKDTLISESSWGRLHWKTLVHCYGKAPFFKQYAEQFESLYRQTESLARLSDVNALFLRSICELLGIKTKITWSMDYALTEGKSERLANLCKSAGGDHYLSGPAAKDYIDEKVFEQAGVKLSFMDYSGYPEYPQLHGKFEHGVTVLDLIFNTGPDAPRFMKSFDPGRHDT